MTIKLGRDSAMAKRVNLAVRKPLLSPAFLVSLALLFLIFTYEWISGRSLTDWLPNKRNEQASGSVALEDAKIAFEDGQLVPRDLEEHEQWRLTHAMMYWTHSHPVPRPSPHPLFPTPTVDGSAYITWEQDFAGLNNVRLQAEVLVMLAACFRRTLVMPDHLAGAMDHQHETPTAFSDFFDFTDLSRWIHIISMEQYLTERGIAANDTMRTDRGALQDYLLGNSHNDTAFPRWSANSDVLVVPSKDDVSKRTGPSLEEFLTGKPSLEYTDDLRQAKTLHFQTSNEVRLFGHVAGFMYFPTQAWQDYYYAQLRDHFHYRRDLVANASLVVHTMRKRFNTTVYNALHDRVGDFQSQFPDFIVDEQTMADHLLLTLGKAAQGQPLYISAKEANETRFTQVKAAFPHSVYGSVLLAELLPGLPPVLQAPIEQLVCSVAQRFVGTFGSTFTSFIHRLRGHHHPSLVPDKDVYYINRPTEPEKYRQMADNATEQTQAAWWPQPEGWPLVHEGTWTREWFWTWQFDKSQAQRDSIVFQPVR